MGIQTYLIEEDSVRVVNDDGPGIDAFGRQRVAQPETIFDSKQCFDNLPLLYDDQEVSGSGTGSTHSTARASTTLDVSATTAGRRVRQTFMRFNYQPGKSQRILCTGILQKSGGGTGITRGFGYYDDNNGIFLRDNEGTIEFVIRSSTSGSPVDNAVAQANWNIDKMDGSGPSGVTLDLTKTHILFIDFAWLGVSRVRMGFVIGGAIVYCHEFNHANELDVVYMSTPNLPIRYEIENDGTGAASEIEHICASVESEGGSQNNGYLRHIDSNQVSNLAAGTAYALLGGRLKSTHLGATIQIENVSVIGSTNDLCDWELVISPTVAGTFTYNDVPNSAVQVAKGAVTNTVTGGTEVNGGFFSTNLGQTIQTPNAIHPGSAIDGTPQEWVLLVRPITNNISLKASVTWRELL